MSIVELEIKSRLFFESFLAFYTGWNKGQASLVEEKKQHCLRVADLAGKIAAAMHLDREDVALARITGLLHDLGRFPQLLKYNTYDDASSGDHAAMGVDEIERGNVLHDVDPEVARIVKIAVYQHNKPVLPDSLGERELFFCKILRDANHLDKLDTLTKFLDMRGNPHAAGFAYLLNSKGISEQVADAFLNGRMVDKEFLKTRDDLKVMQLSWVYDLNFKASFRIVSKERYVDRIYSSLPKRDVVIDMYRHIRIYVENQFMN